MLRPLALALAMALPQAATATEARFELQLRGLNAGQLQLRATRTASAYAAAARLETAGVARLLRRLRFDATVQGRIQAGQPRPETYREDVDTGRRESRTEIAWTGGTPRLLRAEPAREPQPWHLDPATQGDALDPLTVLMQLLADIPPEAACRLDLPLFDGRRRGQVTLAPTTDPSTGTDAPHSCAGEFRRIAGYSEDELAEARRFPFHLTYAPADDGTLRVAEIEAQSPYGTARLIRR